MVSPPAEFEWNRPHKGVATKGVRFRLDSLEHLCSNNHEVDTAIRRRRVESNSLTIAWRTARVAGISREATYKGEWPGLTEACCSHNSATTFPLFLSFSFSSFF